MVDVVVALFDAIVQWKISRQCDCPFIVVETTVQKRWVSNPHFKHCAFTSRNGEPVDVAV
jgi:hypothetical protein